MMEANELTNLVRKITERYVLDGIGQLEIMKEIGIPNVTTSKHWSVWLKSKEIFKQSQMDEEIRILWESRRANISTGRWTFLVLANGVLLDLNDFEQNCRRKARTAAKEGIALYESVNHAEIVPTTQRYLLFVHLPFEFHQLKAPSYFHCFQRILWLIGVHFDSNFDTGRWKVDDQTGLCNRSDTDRSQVKELSQLHNTIFEALARYRRQEERLIGPFTCVAFRQLERIVSISHHRQIPDVVGAMRLIQRNVAGVQPLGQKPLVTVLCEQLYKLAVQSLEPRDPRVQVFDLLKELPNDHNWDPQGHMSIAIDAYCRHFWYARLGSNDIKAYYSYNQASFPRAEPGEFYEKFQGRSLDQILVILRQVDLNLGSYSIPTFCLWHTAINYLFQEESKYSDAEGLCRDLIKRILGPFELHLGYLGQRLVDFDTVESHCRDLAKKVLTWLKNQTGGRHSQLLRHGQLGFDVVKTFYLLGRSQEMQARNLNLNNQFVGNRIMFQQALLHFGMAFQLRSLTAQRGIWDPLLKAVLTALISVGEAIGIGPCMSVWKRRLQAVISTVSDYDRAQQDIESRIKDSG